MTEPSSQENSRPFRVEELTKAHNRKSFICGSKPLDQYFKTQVSQDIRRRFGKCFVAVDTEDNQIAGFYTLSATNITFSDLPEKFIKGLPRYPVVPAVLIGRLAVALDAQGKKLGTALLAHAIETIATGNIGAFAVVVDAKDDTAISFYQRHSFELLENEEKRLVLPVDIALKALR